MFIDKTAIKIKAGNGGDGHKSFHQEKFVPNGGPDGGDGGRGGSIIFVATLDMTTLLDFYYTKHFRAVDGEKGGIKNCSGKMGGDLIIKVPCGTLVKDSETNGIIADLYFPDKPVTVLKGGKGGMGNARFATSRRQAPDFAQKGEVTVEREVVLELKTIADVGLVGYPNVGKSTLLAAMSAARPKIANYHFTTLSPNLGVVKYHDASFVVADIPGLIEGASAGAGLGLEFLRHIERTRIIVHVVDISGSEDRDPLEDYRIINKELHSYSEKLSALPQIVALNKCDLLTDETAVKRFKKEVDKGTVIVEISGATTKGLDILKDRMAEALKQIPPAMPIEHEIFSWEAVDYNAYEITRIDTQTFEIVGGLVDKLSKNVVFDNIDSLNYFHKMLKEHGIIKKLYEMGAKDGDTVIMQDTEFDFIV